MSDERLPHLRGQIEAAEPFRDPRAAQPPPPSLPPRDAAKHREYILDQIDTLRNTVAARAASTRDEEASREVIVVHPEPGSDLDPSRLSDKREDTRVVGVDPSTGLVLLDAASAELEALRKKADAFGDPSKVTQKGRPKNEPLIAPIKHLALADLEDLAREPLDSLAAGPQWLELSCRGGLYDPAATDASRRQVTRQLAQISGPLELAAEFVSTTSVVFYVKADLKQLEDLVSRVDCVFEVGLAKREIRDWLYFDLEEQVALDVNILPPSEDAPVVVLLDSGIADWHPMLAPAIRRSDCVVPGHSDVDVEGHGTQMAGVALYGDRVGEVLGTSQVRAPHWLTSVKVYSKHAVTADESERALWPPMTVEAFARAEREDEGMKVFAMAVTAALDTVEPTLWSQAIEQLAWNGGEGRLVLVSAGNADTDDIGLLEGYPQLNLVQPIEDPAQAWNSLTVGASTERGELPPSDAYREYQVVGAPGGVSPHTTSKPLDASKVPNKPEVVLEGGNVASDGALPDATVPTLTALTTGHQRSHPLALLWATSEATAAAAHLAASILQETPNLRPATVRGLIVHAASWTDVMAEQFESLDDRLRICGYGVPDTELALSCTRERATVIVEDALPSGRIIHVPKNPPPKRATTPKTKEKLERVTKLFRLPVPEEVLLADPDAEVELRVTLSYFAEIQTFRRRAFRGLDLRWDMQGPQESEDQFQWRINRIVRDQSEDLGGSSGWNWDIGPQRRQRGTVQSDRWRGPASMLAGEKLIAVMPRLGWWNERVEFRTKELPFSLIVTVQAEGIDLYTPISVALTAGIEIPV